MTEQKLLELGFLKVEVLDEESQNGYDYYYYMLDILPGLSLISSASDESTENWNVYNFDWDSNKALTEDSIKHLIWIASDLGYLRHQ